MLVIELVDAGLVAWRGGAQVGGPSPGVALLDPNGLVVGSEAAAQQRLRPAHAFDRFWVELDTTPLTRQATGVRSSADLAFLHLQGFLGGIARQEDERVVLALPGNLRPRQLGLLAGIASTLGLPMGGFVDLAVAAGASVPTGMRMLHLDVHLHRAVLTELVGDDVLQRGRVEAAPRVGLRALHEAWARWIAGSMVERTRFDPLHHAASEQSLMDRLPASLECLESGAEVEVVVESPHGPLSVTFAREDALLAVEAFYSQLVDLVRGQLGAAPLTLLLSHRAASLPGLAGRLGGLAGVELRRLDATAVPRGLERWSGSDEGSLWTALPRHLWAAPELPRSSTPARAPTHLLHAGQAYRLGDGELAVGTQPAGSRTLRLPGRPAGVSRQHCRLLARDGVVELLDDSRYGTWRNGQRVRGSALLAPGDTLRLGTPGVTLELIEVE